MLILEFDRVIVGIVDLIFVQNYAHYVLGHRSVRLLRQKVPGFWSLHVRVGQQILRVLFHASLETAFRYCLQ